MIFDRNNSELSVFYELKISPIRFFTESSFLNNRSYIFHKLGNINTLLISLFNNVL